MILPSQKLKLGVIGLGEQSVNNLLPSLFLSPYIDIQAICDIDPAKLYAVSSQKTALTPYLDYKEMIDVETLDAVVVCSFPEVHYKVAKYVISKGLHVFVEKPPVNNIHQLNELIHLSEKYSVKTGVGMNFGYTDCHNIICDVINENDFGELTAVSIEHISSKPTIPLWDLDSILDSFLLAQLIHPLDYILSFGGKYKALTVYSSGIHSPIFIQVMIEFENSIIGCLKSGTFYPRFRHNIEIISKTGNTISVKDLSTIEVTQKNALPPFGLKPKNCTTVYTPSPLKAGYSKAGYTSELDAFFCHILFGSSYNHTFSHMLPVYEALDKISTSILQQHDNVRNMHNASIDIFLPGAMAAK